MSRTKITIVGAGNVGATTAMLLAEKELGDLALIDIVIGMPQGKALDIKQSLPVLNSDTRIIGTNNYDDTAGSQIVVITAGVPRKPGMSRDDLLKINTDIVKDVTTKIAKRSPDAILIVVSNPLDAMTYTAYKVSGFPRQRVIGMAGVLDSARFRAFIAQELNISVHNITAFVLGSHGDTMVPSTRYTTVAGVPVENLLPPEKLNAIVERTRYAGGEIVSLLKTGSAYYAPASAIAEMVEAIVKDKKRILPCAALCEGEYGFHSVFVGVPVKLGAEGMEKIIEFELSTDEKKALQKSADIASELCRQIDSLL